MNKQYQGIFLYKGDLVHVSKEDNTVFYSKTNKPNQYFKKIHQTELTPIKCDNIITENIYVRMVPAAPMIGYGGNKLIEQPEINFGSRKTTLKSFLENDKNIDNGMYVNEIDNKEYFEI